MTERRGDTLLFHTPPVIAAQAAVLSLIHI